MKPSLIGEAEVDDKLHEGLVGATMIGLYNDSSIMSHVKPLSHVITCSFSFAHQVERNEFFEASCEPCQASHGLPLDSHEMH